MILLLKTFGIRHTLRILKLKWIKGQCRHICKFCDYKSQCFSEYEG